MARYPRALWRPVSGLDKDPPIQPVGVIFHSSASQALSLYDWFNGPSGGIESHLHIPKTSRAPIEQYRDTTREADANYRGNSWRDGKVRKGFLSVETQGEAHEPWTDYQLAEMEAFARWAADVHGFPLELAPSVQSHGLGYHVMFGTGAGTMSWSNAAGKTCPGAKRIEQFKTILLPRLTSAHTEDEVALTDQEVEQIVDRWQEKYGARLAQFLGLGKPNGIYNAETVGGVPVVGDALVRNVSSKIAVATGSDPAAIADAVRKALAEALQEG